MSDPLERENQENVIRSLRETLAEIEAENKLLEQAVAANNALILYLFEKNK